jgi:hypothetical protein
VAGSILFTPNAVIFDPDPSDPLGKRVFHPQKGVLGLWRTIVKKECKLPIDG